MNALVDGGSHGSGRQPSLVAAAPARRPNTLLSIRARYLAVRTPASWLCSSAPWDMALNSSLAAHRRCPSFAVLQFPLGVRVSICRDVWLLDFSPPSYAMAASSLPLLQLAALGTDVMFTSGVVRSPDARHARGFALLLTNQLTTSQVNVNIV